MKINQRLSNSLVLLIFIQNVITVFQNSVYAQIIPDYTLKNESSIVTSDVINGIISDRITGGAIRGNNLFHSFQEFNISELKGAYFSNPVGIENILTRITGNNPSNIMGKLGVIGNANLFLMNPKGIIFGQTARLDLSGSFLATTANKIIFADGTNFSATQPLKYPLLTISVPIGLEIENNSGAIHVQGTGYNLTIKDPLFSPIVRSNISTGLQVNSGQTLALIGGDIILENGTLTAAKGSIDLGSVAQGFVNIIPKANGWNFNYDNISVFKDISLSQQSLLDVSGLNAGSIYIHGKNISLTDGSTMLIQNQGSQTSGNININASGLLELIGSTSDGKLASSLRNETLDIGNGGDINILTQQLLINNGGLISTRTFSNATGGNIIINALESVKAIGFFAANPAIFSNISSLNESSGNAGNISLSTGRLVFSNGARLTSTTVGSGNGGNVTINAQESIDIIGLNPINTGQSMLSASTLNNGNAGTLEINTSRLTVKDGARINSATLATGNAGSLLINAKDFVEVSGIRSDFGLASMIDSSATIVNINVQKALKLPPVPTGASGDVTINTGLLKVTNGALVSVKNDGPGNGGNLKINANSILLDNQGAITAATHSGEGGNMILQATNLQLRHNSLLNTNAGGSGNGGNITLNADTLVTLENSDITANALQGKGGNININTQGIFASADSDITATSQLGINGVVQIKMFNLDFKNALTLLEDNFINTDQVVSGSCLVHKNSTASLSLTGSGGLRLTPYETIKDRYSVYIINPLSPLQSREQKLPLSKTSEWKIGDRILEAKTIIITPDGRKILGILPKEELILIPNLICYSPK